MKRATVLGLRIAVIPFLFLAAAQAGNVNGTIERNKKDAAADKQSGNKPIVVVWIEGAEETHAPAPLLGISLKNQQFAPDFLVLARGQRLQVSNEDDVPHSVNSLLATAPVNLKPHEKGELQPTAFRQAGMFDLSCSLHSSMRARVFAVPTQNYATSIGGGAFTIPNIPPGSYVLKAWDERAGIVAQTVTVPRFGAVNVTIVLRAPQISAQ